MTRLETSEPCAPPSLSRLGLALDDMAGGECGAVQGVKPIGDLLETDAQTTPAGYAG